ncbi:permease [uncultured Sulfitobacter sp.]|uniref:permease n=1 Tax=uncultured Sulfitobacter sp. TaxID=191468 RepID=UPI00345910CC
MLLLLSVLIFSISYVESYFPPQRTRRILGQRQGLGANTMAALLGTLAPFCSCSSGSSDCPCQPSTCLKENQSMIIKILESGCNKRVKLNGNIEKNHR